MSIKKGKKQVYKVGNCGCTKGIVRLTCRVHGLLDAPLKPKKSKVEKWFKVEYMTTLKPPKTLFEAHGDRYYPIGNGKPFKVDELRVYKVSSSN